MREDVTPEQLRLLGILGEECAEVILITSKLRRFGRFSYHPEDPDRVTNEDKLRAEVGDIMGIVKLLIQEGFFTQSELEALAEKKIQKVAYFSQFEV